MIGNGPFNKFRKDHQVIIVSDSYFKDGVIMPGERMYTKAKFSVQAIKNNEEIQGFAEGRRVSDWRRLYSDTKLPLAGDQLFVSASVGVNNGTLATEDGKVIAVGAYVGDKEGMSNPALVVIDGREYEVIERISWQNGIISHYKYYVVRKTYG